ncbi:MAG: hypothetical protein EF807_05650 [Candidatus Methanolliviera hydrocarbonicum]|uniref:Uncharacterized protein n=1 Tax=Candidatus Methanolliviera hydrocarbonicum TaxID=2491085 RepID=A0A520KX50_9EURY|nr:MAG: hypothetical protein EF807_05650 [Candidatus Methanolliviera hydrocarbonicum]
MNMKKLPIILVISLLLISLAPACVAAGTGIKIVPIQGVGYHIEKMKHWIDDGKNSVMIWERVKNTSGDGYWADVVAWVVDDDGEGEEIARYYKSLGYLDKEEDKLFTVSFLKDKKWEDAERPLIVYIKIEPRLTWLCPSPCYILCCP